MRATRLAKEAYGRKSWPWWNWSPEPTRKPPGNRDTDDKDDEVRAALEVLFVLVLAYFVLSELWELVTACREDGTPLAYLLSPANWVDLLVYGLMAAGDWLQVLQHFERARAAREQHLSLIE